MKSKLREAEEFHDQYIKYLVRDYKRNQLGWFTVNEMNNSSKKHMIFSVGNDYWDSVNMNWYSVHGHKYNWNY